MNGNFQRTIAQKSVHPLSRKNGDAKRINFAINSQKKQTAIELPKSDRIAKIFIFLLLKTDSPLLTAQHHSTLTLQSNYLAILARPLILLKSQSPLRHCVTAP